MKATIEKQEKNQVELLIEVDEERVEQALEKAYRSVVRRVTVPGFRKGKAPRRIIEARFGKGVLYEEAFDALLPEVYEQAVQETKIEPIDRPNIDIVEFEDGKPLKLKAAVDVRPEVELGDYKGLKGTKKIKKVDNEQVDDVLEDLRERQAELASVEHREAVEQGDFVTMDFEGFLDGKPFQGGAASNYDLEVGSGQFIPGFEEQLIGLKLNEEAEVKVAFPEDYQADELAGKEATFKVTIKEIKVKRLPEMDDEFAKDVSEKETLLELRGDIRAQLEKRAADEADRDLRDSLIDQATTASTVDVPHVMIHHELDHMVDEFYQRLAYSRISPDRYHETTGTSREELHNELHPEAEQRVKRQLTLEGIAAAEGIEISEEEVDQRIDELVEQQGGAGTDVRDYYEQRRDGIENALRLQKAVDKLIETADVTVEYIDAADAGPVDEADSDAEASEDETAGSDQ